MAAQTLLSSLANVNAYLGVANANDQALLQRMLAAASSGILSYLNRGLFQASYTDHVDGEGQRRQFLRQWPVLSVSLVQIGQQDIPALMLPACGCGYAIQPWDGTCPGKQQSVDLLGHSFGHGLSRGLITYSAGYAVTGEAQSVGSNNTITPLAPSGPWGADVGVSYANSTALTKVASAPAVGQYAVADNTSATNPGLYTFNAADNGAAVLLSYSFIPFDIEQACVQWVAEMYKYKDRVGQTTKSLGGAETVSYTQKDLPDFIKLILQPYRRVLPV